MDIKVFDDRVCSLGEGPLWHPLRGQFFWFDINGMKLLSRKGDETFEWSFDHQASAAGWTGENELLVAGERSLFLLDLGTGNQAEVAPLEAGVPETRSNDGRADPQGGFWIGTMGKQAEPGLGSIYRWHRGELRKLFGGITVSNSMCFSPDGTRAYYADTRTHRIMRTGLDADGWPAGEPEVFVDLAADRLRPDGAVVDTEGCLWSAQYGASRVARYSPDGEFLSEIAFPAVQTTCPSFGGPDLRTLLVTSATQKMEAPSADQGLTYCVELPVRGQEEHRVLV